MVEEIEVEVEIELPKSKEIGRFRRWFREAAEHASDWREAAQQDFEFVAGKQWSDDDIAAFEESGRPAITVNRIKPLINVLSGYQRLNRYDIDFLPRTSDDADICEVRKGVTKYVMDACEYETHESLAFLDSVVGGLGWLEVGYKHDSEIGDGEAFVRREDPFSIYVDPEAHTQDFSDAKYICRAKWVDKDELSEVYPEHEEAIQAQYAVYDAAEKERGNKADPLWYKREIQKVRLVECWYKTRAKKSRYILADGAKVAQEEMQIEYFLQGLVAGIEKYTVEEVRVCSFMDHVLLEDMKSPYEHGEIPFVPLLCYYYGVGDYPAGFVRDLKDPQREINKRRIQNLHILNTSSNGGGWMEEDAMSREQKAKFEEMGNHPGYYAEVRSGAISQGKIMDRAQVNPPVAMIQAEQMATADLTAISGINETLMGTDVASSVSGRAIELKQKQAITHIAPMFDNLRRAKKKIATLLWGRRGRKGVIPQFYTADKVYRVQGVNGQQFIRVNQEVMEQDPLGRTIYHTLNDLSQGEFDIVVADTQASTTARQAQLWGLVDAVSKLGVPGDLVFDIILDLSDIPNKEMVKQRYAERQQQQAQAAQQQSQAQLELEMIKNQNLNQSIAFKDAPLPIQFAMAAKQGLIDPQIGQYAIDVMVQQMFPQLAEQMAQQRALQEQQAQIQEQLAQQMQAQGLGGGAPPPQAQGQGQQSKPLTQAAMQSLISGATPAM